MTGMSPEFLSPPMSVDGVVTEEGERLQFFVGHRVRWYWIKRLLLRRPVHLLVVADPEPANNGVYVVQRGSWQRPTREGNA